ncbi:unnamed protein product, partial [Choristocarpus tenellus]
MLLKCIVLLSCTVTLRPVGASNLCHKQHLSITWSHTTRMRTVKGSITEPRLIVQSSVPIPRLEALKSGFWRSCLAWGGFVTASRALEPDESSAGSTVEGIAKAASKIPGYGPPDLYYPEWFAGSWMAHHKVVSVSTPLGEDKVDEPLLLREVVATVGKEVDYKALFVRRGVNNKLVVADRGFNEKGFRNVRAPGSVAEVKWEAGNPNILTVVLSDGSFVERRVTKRSAEQPAP